jgi:predicted  nucleic acid-binding Zn-ribbon protein
MSLWQCTIRGCGEEFPDAESVLVHQATAHDPHRCRICAAEFPEGYFAIRHVLDEHGRAEYVRAYDADAGDIREREAVRDTVENAVDVDGVRDRLAEEE